MFVAFILARRLVIHVELVPAIIIQRGECILHVIHVCRCVHWASYAIRFLIRCVENAHNDLNHSRWHFAYKLSVTAITIIQDGGGGLAREPSLSIIYYRVAPFPKCCRNNIYWWIFDIVINALKRLIIYLVKKDLIN